MADMRKVTALLIFFILIFLAPSSFAVSQTLIERLDLSTTAFKQLMAAGDSEIPQDMLKNCEAIVIFPRTINVAWGLGGQYGRGVALRHDKKRHDWTAPAFYTIGGLTIGPQIGGQAIDIVLVVMNEKGLNSLLQSKSTLGGDAGVALGPVGRNATASTDLGFQAEIYSYSRAKGLYIGLSLKGAVVTPDAAANREYYGSAYAAKDILIDKKGNPQKYARPLLSELRRYTPGRQPVPWIIFVWAIVLFVGLAFFLASRRK